MLRAVLFDIDGTLVDSNDLHARAWQEAFAKFGFEIPFSRVRSQIGKGSDQLLPALIGEVDAKRTGEKLAEYRSRLFQEKYLDQVRPFPRVRELFQRILRDGRKIALATSASQEELSELKKIAHIDDLIHEETSADDAEKSKPHPDIVASALKRVAVHADEAVFVGDTPYDAMAATKIHVRTIGVLCGRFPEQELRKAGAIEIYESPSDLLARYEKSALAEASAAA
ncbi:MAG: HAD family hydrolase [Acidobacteria bacterium]|nr:HAD family hydrolase [Acidobacteriota bacterium]